MPSPYPSPVPEPPPRPTAQEAAEAWPPACSSGRPAPPSSSSPPGRPGPRARRPSAGGTLPLTADGQDVTGVPAALAVVGLAALVAVFAVRGGRPPDRRRAAGPQRPRRGLQRLRRRLGQRGPGRAGRADHGQHRGHRRRPQPHRLALHHRGRRRCSSCSPDCSPCATAAAGPPCRDGTSATAPPAPARPPAPPRTPTGPRNCGRPWTAARTRRARHDPQPQVPRRVRDNGSELCPARYLQRNTN